MNIEFAWPLSLLALPLPLLAAWLLPRAPDTAGSALRLPFYAALTAVAGETRALPSRLRLAFAVVAWLLLVAAALRPQFPGDPVQLPVSGRDLLMAVDISGSMETQDMQLGRQVTDRLTAVEVGRTLGKEPIVVADKPGFASSRLGLALGLGLGSAAFRAADVATLGAESGDCVN